VAFALLVAALLLALAALLIRDPRVAGLFVAWAAIAIATSLTLYAFGEDDYTQDGRTRWETHARTTQHVAYIVVLIVLGAVVGAVAVLAKRRVSLRPLALASAFTFLIVWYVGVLAFDNN